MQMTLGRRGSILDTMSSVPNCRAAVRTWGDRALGQAFTGTDTAVSDIIILRCVVCAVHNCSVAHVMME